MKPLTVLSSLLLPAALAAPAMANPTVTSPYNNSTVTSPFTLTANASSCSNQTVSVIGYSLDSSSSTTTVSGTSIQNSVSAAIGGHTIHVKAWGNSGAVCVSDVAITVIDASFDSSSGGPSVNNPQDGSSVSSPFNLSAYLSSCSGQPVSTMGYSVDSSPLTTTQGGTTLNQTVSTGTGGHTIHVKAWGNGGASCVTNIGVTVSGTSGGVPPNATNISNLQVSGSWKNMHDDGTGGSSNGWSGLTGSPSRSGNARQFSTSYSGYGGERYETSFSDDTTAHNFVYDAWLYVQDTAAGITNLEMDMNQVIGNGWTVIMGVQCDGWSGTWDVTTNMGSATSPNDQWVQTGAKCNPKSWGVNAWHHVQIALYRDDSGFVTYQWVALDGAQQTLNLKTFSGFALGWRKIVVTNFQVDGGTSSSYGSNIFMDNLNVSYW